MSTPIFEKLKGYHAQNRISFAMPGHKNGCGLNKALLECDVTELRKTVDLHGKSDEVSKSCEKLSRLYGSEKSHIVTCGSTTCVQAMLAGSLNRGDTVLAGADCHMSVINTCALCGFNIRFIPKGIDSEFLIPKRLFPIEDMLKKYADIKAVLITSPTYYGICEDIEKLSEICHRYNVPLLVDEAHGAHFIADESLPQSAVKSGADAVCQSAHKTLNALTGAAFLHLSGKLLDYSRIENALYMFESSSPSYVIAASAELSINDLDGWDDAVKECKSFTHEILKNTHIKVLKNDDITRLVLNFSVYGVHGAQVEDILCEKYGIDIEMSDRDNIVLIVTASNTRDDLKKLYDALCEITKDLPIKNKTTTICESPAISDIVKPYEIFGADTIEIDVKDSAGYVCAVNVCAYPPGIPTMAMGAEITHEQIEYIEYLLSINATVKGINDRKVRVINKL